MSAALSNPVFVEWLSTLAVFFGVAMLLAGLMALVSRRILRLAPENTIWIFVVGLAFLSSLASVSITPTDSWSEDFLLVFVPVLGVAIYFMPSLAAAAARHPSLQAVFVLNLLFGWTIVGWFVAITWTLRRPQPRPGYRITPFGAVAIGEPDPGRNRAK
jgi:hypothetical protein